MARKVTLKRSCECEVSHEGGYGWDGKSGRYGIEFCPLHAAALELLKALIALYEHHDGGCECEPLKGQMCPHYQAWSIIQEVQEPQI